MAKDNLFEQDLNLQGIAKVINLRLDALTSLDSSSPIYDKIGGVYFNILEDSIRVKTADGWYSTVLYNGGLDENQVLCVFKPNEYNKVERFITREVAPRLLAIDVDSSPYLVEFVNFTNFLDPDIFVDAVINNDTRLVTSNAVYDYVATAISGLTGDYLPLAGGTMSGNINMQDNYIIFAATDRNPVNIYAANSPINLFNSILNIELDLSGENYVNITTAFAENPELHLFPWGIIPINVSPVVSKLGTVANFFGYGYIYNIYTDSVMALDGNLYLKNDTTTLHLKTTEITTNKVIRPLSNLSTSLGAPSYRWNYVYANDVYSRKMTLTSSSDVAYVDDIVSTIDLVSPSDTAIATESAVASLFGTIETITGVAITNMESVGMVTRYVGASAADYVLTAADTWVHKNTLNYWDLELISGTTYRLVLTDDYDIASFRFVTNSQHLDNNLILGVRGGNLLQMTYDNSIRMYLGNEFDTLTTEGTYIIEFLGDARFQAAKTLFFGGTGRTAATVGLTYVAQEYDTIGVVPTIINNGALYAVEGISTDGDNLWEFGGTVTGTSITPSDLLVVTVNGVYYKIVAQEFTPAT